MPKLKKPRKYLRKFSWIDAKKSPVKRKQNKLSQWPYFFHNVFKVVGCRCSTGMKGAFIGRGRPTKARTASSGLPFSTPASPSGPSRLVCGRWTSPKPSSSSGISPLLRDPKGSRSASKSETRSENL